MNHLPLSILPLTPAEIKRTLTDRFIGDEIYDNVELYLKRELEIVEGWCREWLCIYKELHPLYRELLKEYNVILNSPDVMQEINNLKIIAKIIG